MEKRRAFYISLICGLTAFALLIASVNLPAQLVFETKPFARLVMLSGHLDNWTFEQLRIEQSEFELVTKNYAEFMTRNKVGSDSSDSYSDDSDEEDFEVETDIQLESEEVGNSTNDNTRYDKRGSGSDSDSSESLSSSDEEGGVDSDNSEAATEQQLEDAPVFEHVGLGLFHGRICEMSRQKQQETCHSISTNEAIYKINNEVSSMINDINMPMWNNLRVESIFSALSCGIGLIFLLATLRPCCEHERLPQYLSALSFCACGVLIFIPIVRITLVSSDFEQTLRADYNVTTKLMTSWSLVLSGIASPLAFAASISIMATKWAKVSKKLYHKLSTRAAGNVPGQDVEMAGAHLNGNPPMYTEQ